MTKIDPFITSGVCANEKEDDASERPIGTNSAKKAKLLKGSSNSAIVDLVQVQREHQAWMKEQHIENQELRIMAMDPNTMQETQRKFFELRQSQILQRWLDKSLTRSPEESKDDP